MAQKNDWKSRNNTQKIKHYLISSLIAVSSYAIVDTYQAKQEEKVELTEAIKQEEVEKLAQLKKEQEPKETYRNIGALIIDMQEEFLNKVRPDELKKDMTCHLAMLDYYKEKNIPVFVINTSNRDSLYTPIQKKVNLMENVIFLDKSGTCAFNNSVVTIGNNKNKSLEEVLQKYKIDNLIIQGVNTNACILVAVYGAIEEGYGVITSPDLMANNKTFDDNKVIQIYKNNTLFVETYKEIINLIDSNLVEENMLTRKLSDTKQFSIHYFR